MVLKIGFTFCAKYNFVIFDFVTGPDRTEQTTHNIKQQQKKEKRKQASKYYFLFLFFFLGGGGGG